MIYKLASVGLADFIVEFFVAFQNNLAWKLYLLILFRFEYIIYYYLLHIIISQLEISQQSSFSFIFFSSYHVYLFRSQLNIHLSSSLLLFDFPSRYLQHIFNLLCMAWGHRWLVLNESTGIFCVWVIPMKNRSPMNSTYSWQQSSWLQLRL